MAIKSFKPYTPSRRNMTVSAFDGVDKKAKPERSLLETVKKNAGRNSYGRICFLDNFQADVLANFGMDKFDAKTAYCLGESGNEYDQGLIAFFKQVFEAAGGKVITDSFPTGNSDFNSYLNKAKRIRQIGESGVALVNEGVEPEFVGLVNYSIIGLIQLELGPTLEPDLTNEEAMIL